MERQPGDIIGPIGPELVSAVSVPHQFPRGSHTVAPRMWLNAAGASLSKANSSRPLVSFYHRA